MTKANSFFAVACCALFSVNADASHEIPEPQVQALIDFYHATGGDNWHRNQGWLEEDSDPCDWEGVVCRNEGTFGSFRRLRELRLEKNNLTGQVPEAISELNFLRYLTLSGNRLEGPIPAFLINEMQSLEFLDLSDNQLSGDLPEFQGNRGFSHINLSRNRISGSLPASWAQIPSTFANESAPGSINLSNNQLSGSIPDEWAGFALAELHLRNNRFSGELSPVLAEMPQLRTLDLSGNEFSGPLPDWLQQLNLRKLHLQRNQFTGGIDNAVAAMDDSTWAELKLADNRFSGPIPDTLMDLLFTEVTNDFVSRRDVSLPALDLCWNDLDAPGAEMQAFLSTRHDGADILGCLGPQRAEIDPTISGSWFDPARSGEGIAQQLLHNGSMFVYWFGFDPRDPDSGDQFWAFEAVSPNSQFARIEPLYVPEGGRFGRGLGDQPVLFDRRFTGRIYIDRLESNRQQVRYSQIVAHEGQGFSFSGRDIGIAHTMALEHQQLTRLAGTTCDNQQPHQELSALWMSPHSNEGFVVEVIEGGQGVVYWFTFEPGDSGRQAWMTGVGEFSGNTLHIDNLVQPVGGRFGPYFDPAEVEYRNWGELTLEFTDFWSGQASWNSELEDYGTGDYPLVRLTIPMLADCER